MVRYCEICGRELRTGRKYCYVCRSIQKAGTDGYIERKNFDRNKRFILLFAISSLLLYSFYTLSSNKALFVFGAMVIVMLILILLTFSLENIKYRIKKSALIFCLFMGIIILWTVFNFTETIKGKIIGGIVGVVFLIMAGYVIKALRNALRKNHYTQSFN